MGVIHGIEWSWLYDQVRAYRENRDQKARKEKTLPGSFSHSSKRVIYDVEANRARKVGHSLRSIRCVLFELPRRVRAETVSIEE